MYYERSNTYYYERFYGFTKDSIIKVQFMSQDSQKVITFKVPEALEEAMKGIPNRSEFIRTAILAALDQICPLCKGSGILKPNQQKHWTQFARDHAIERCGQCDAFHLVCRCGAEDSEAHP